MKFQAVNEFTHFSFSDCILTGIERNPAGIQLTLEALIVLPENSQNTNFTKSYAGPVQLRLIGGQLTDSIKEGYRYRDADGKLLESVPDTVLSPAEVGHCSPHSAMCTSSRFSAKQEPTGVFSWSSASNSRRPRNLIRS